MATKNKKTNLNYNYTIAKKAYIDNVTHALAKIRPYDGPTDFLKEMNNNNNQQQLGMNGINGQQQRNSNRPMSVDIKRQSFNAYGGGRSNRNSMRSEFVC